MSVWRLIIHTDEVKKYCLEHNAAAMGWSFNELMNDSSPRYSELKAKADSKSKWQFCQEARIIEAANQLTNIQWHYAGNKNNLVPPTLEAAFTDERTFRSINDYDVEAFSAWLMRAFEAKTFHMAYIIEPCIR